MAIIYSYPRLATPRDSDLLVLTHTDEETDEKSTNNITISNLAAFMLALGFQGTARTVPLFSQSGFQLVDSIIVADDEVNPTKMTVEGDLTVQQILTLEGVVKDSDGDVGTEGQVLVAKADGTLNFERPPAADTFIYVQNVPATVWNITHTLNKLPSVMVVDTGNTVVQGEITYTDNSNITINFTAGFAGKAYLN